METLLLVIVGIVFTIGFGYLVKLAKGKISNEELSSVLVSAIAFAEEKAEAFAKEKIHGIEYTGKMAIAKEYIDKIDPKIIKQYGDKIETLIESKLGQIEGVGASAEKAVK